MLCVIMYTGLGNMCCLLLIIDCNRLGEGEKCTLFLTGKEQDWCLYCKGIWNSGKGAKGVLYVIVNWDSGVNVMYFM